jgi:hypothetical protein
MGPAGPTGPAGGDIEMSGSRLVARYTTTTDVGADGAQRMTKAFAGWFDTQRNEYCGVELASDGQQRCLPNDTGTATGGSVSVSSGSGQSAYSDAACTKPVVLVGKCQQVPHYFRTWDTTTCPNGLPHLFLIGAQLSSYYFGGPGNCIMQPIPAGSSVYDASSTAEIPPASFVAFTVTTQTQ